MAKENVVVTYSKKSAAKRVDYIMDNYSVFEQMIEGEEECLYVKIRREQEELRNKRDDLGVRVQTSNISDITGNTATKNADVSMGIRNGDWKLAAKGTKHYAKYRHAIETLQLMKDDYSIVRSQLKGIKDEDNLFHRYLNGEMKNDELADTAKITPNALRARICRFRSELRDKALNFIEDEEMCA